MTKRTHKQLIARFDRLADRALTAMLRVEKYYGHHGVFIIIREWLNKPMRGQKWAFKRHLRR